MSRRFPIALSALLITFALATTVEAGGVNLGNLRAFVLTILDSVGLTSNGVPVPAVEADTLATVTARGATTSTALTLGNGATIIGLAGAALKYQIDSGDHVDWAGSGDPHGIALSNGDPGVVFAEFKNLNSTSLAYMELPAPHITGVVSMSDSAYFSWDSDTDYVWRNPSTGAMEVASDVRVTLNGGVIELQGESVSIYANTAPAWSIAAVSTADYLAVAGRPLYVGDGIVTTQIRSPQVLGLLAATTTSAGGTLTVAGGAGGTTSGNGGQLVLNSGAPTSGNGGALTIQAAAGVGGNNTGGSLSVVAGASNGTGAGAGATVRGGAGGTSGNGGAASLIAGDAGASSGSGGQVSINGGGATDGDGGGLSLTAANGAGTNRSGGTVDLNAGNRTGTGARGVVRTLFAYQTRRIEGAQADLTDASAVTVLTVAFPAGERAGGTFTYTIEVSNGTDFQTLTGLITFACVDKAGTLTTDIDEALVTQSAANSSVSTLTDAWTILDETNQFSVQVNADSSLAAPVITIRYNLDLYGSSSSVTFTTP